MNVCPRCQASLTPGFGALGEDCCAACGGRVLPPHVSKRVLIDELGLDPAMLRDLATHFSGKRLACPGCGQSMSPVTLRSVPVDVCLGCGSSFFDDGELRRLTGGVHEEIRPVAVATDTSHFPDVKDIPFSHYPIRVNGPEPTPDGPVDGRAMWEKALPMYMVEACVLYGVLVVRGAKFGDGTPLDLFLASFGLMGIPVLLSMLVDVDWRSFRPRSGSLMMGRGRHFGGFAGLALTYAAVFLSGSVSTLNAMVSEKFPRVFSVKNALVVGGGALLTALVGTFL